MKTIIPTRLQRLIDDSSYSGGVRQTYDLFIPLLGNKNSGLFFFPEYTDHGPEHIAGVLRSTVELVPKRAWKYLTPEDGVIIALASLLHDVAMVQTADSLLSLIRTHDLPIISEFDHLKWPDLFDDFYVAARRWDERKLLRVLGDKEDGSHSTNYMHDVVHINERSDPETWSIRYRKFLGEFVRQHHARIAHEIARYDFPGSNGALKLVGIPEDLCDLAGLVARSHNLKLRSTYDYLKNKYDGYVECRNSHPVYTMVLLRIADYLQMESSRVNKSWNSVQRLRSPISQMEWNAHLAVREIRPDDDDPESLFVSAKPNTASTFIKMQGLLKGLQKELDTSWAVMSEVFGRRPDLSELGISIRRVKSNLDDEKLYLTTQKPNYFPLAASFDTSGASLLKLLIRPLYGDAPEIGVRELMQNAVDAVRERERMCEMHPELRKVPLSRQRADVLVSVSKKRDGSHYLTVTDKGVGMTAKTVRDYFLKAGASFRQSDAWLKEFSREGTSSVVRSGRFGIGALAAFLLGDRIKVTTRYIRANAEDGVLFEAELNDESVELLRSDVKTVGTTIEVPLRREVAMALMDETTNRFDWSWDWYVFNRPVVERRVLGERLEQELTVPSDTNKDNDDGWKRIYHQDYQEILWTYDHSYNQVLACNGIRVSDNDERYSWGETVPQMPCRVPSISVLDPDANLPLTLTRDSLEGDSFPFATELAYDVAKDFCAYLLLHAPSSGNPAKDLKFFPLQWSETWHPFDELGPLLATRQGTILLHPWHIKEANIRRVLVSNFDISALACFHTLSPRLSGYSLYRPRVEDWLRDLFDFERRMDKVIANLGSGLISGVRLLVTNAESIIVDRDRDSETTALELIEDLDATELSAGDFLFEAGKVGFRKEFDLIYDELSGRSPGAVLEVYFNSASYRVPHSPFTTIWRSLMQYPEIPYDFSDRERKFRKAFDSLSEYVELWKDALEGRWRKAVLMGKLR